MKELSLEKMENLNGGTMSYCDQIEWWMDNNYEGFQGDISDLWIAWGRNCATAE